MRRVTNRLAKSRFLCCSGVRYAFIAQRRSLVTPHCGAEQPINMSFWGVEVRQCKVLPFVPPPEDARLQISQACLAAGAGQREPIDSFCAYRRCRLKASSFAAGDRLLVSEPLLYLANVCAEEGAKSALKIKVHDGPELYVCRLREGRSEFANLDLVLDEYTEFTVEGATLHITGTIHYVKCCLFQAYAASLMIEHRIQVSLSSCLRLSAGLLWSSSRTQHTSRRFLDYSCYA